MGYVFAVLFVIGALVLLWKVAEEREWKLPAGLAAVGAGAAYWWDYIKSFF